MVHLKIEDIIPEFIDANCELGQQLRDQIRGGQPISEDLMVELIIKRVQYGDCCERGCILEDFPQTKSQAVKLTEYGIIPDYVFYIDVHSEKRYSRADGLAEYDFMADPRVFSERLTAHLAEKPHVLSFYEDHFGNAKYVSGLKSKWYVEDTIIDHIRSSLKSRADFARDILDSSKACALQNINIDRSLLSICHSNYGFYCPVTWKNHQTFSSGKNNEETAVIYRPPGSQYRHLYFFRNLKQRDIFIGSPEMFVTDIVFPTANEIPEWIDQHNAAQIIAKEKNLANYCPVTLLEDDVIVKGNHLYLAVYKGTLILFSFLILSFTFRRQIHL
jgi:adenylate kinase family enzyme